MKTIELTDEQYDILVAELQSLNMYPLTNKALLKVGRPIRALFS